MALYVVSFYLIRWLVYIILLCMLYWGLYFIALESIKATYDNVRYWTEYSLYVNESLDVFSFNIANHIYWNVWFSLYSILCLQSLKREINYYFQFTQIYNILRLKHWSFKLPFQVDICYWVSCTSLKHKI